MSEFVIKYLVWLCGLSLGFVIALFMLYAIVHTISSAWYDGKNKTKDNYNENNW